MILYKKPFIAILFLLAFVLVGFGLPKNLQKKVEKELQKVFEVEQFSMISVQVSDELNAELPSKISNANLFKILLDEQSLGYVFVDQAPSKTAQFDYLVVFDTKLKVIHSKVLVYREEYGGEIGSKRWLRQFIGKTGKDRVSHKTNIDAISGATISVRSMTNSIDKLLQTIGILQTNKIL
ncbi:Na+-translocating ferredoxin:NAD+ oxidoreductase RnfG subunit [Saonia flava]|uniref:Na+-translocating ferredoxin:NAD+ oxidoreductase RnfG subunit n=1 Tax=Saonia flava TaxID=523696 RepID=A0A846R208_9FLAO|nr:FMN-binding protein [Saonia flava]NJB72463.1 Na+-translocating ferredoxin:NAD+ oxidoreductase RnfG subunit [Saonia flava]